MAHWLEQVLEYAQDSESPKPYFYWAGLAALSGVVRNRVYLDKFYYKLYPNLYVMLIGRSGIRKGIPVALAKSLVAGINCTRVISGRTSIQKVISELATAYTLPNGGGILQDSVGYLSSSEFANFIIQDPQALTILTDLYDGHYNPEWTNFTKVSGAEKLKGVCLTLFGASNETHFKEAVPDNALGGGFIARTVIVHADKKGGVNPLTSRPRQTVGLDDLLPHLQKVSRVEGSFSWSDAGKARYDEWYYEFAKSDFRDDTGTLERIHDTVLKIAMLISLARTTDLVLEDCDIEEALDQALKVIPGVRKVTMGQGKNPLGPQMAMIIREMAGAPPDYAILKSRLLSRYWGHFDSYDLDRMMTSLQAQGAVKVYPAGQPSGSDTLYVLSPKVVENLNKLVGGD
jgi:hypothetical protein